MQNGHNRRAEALRARFSTQADALMRKNIMYQKRNMGTNICLVSMPVLMCLLLFAMQKAINGIFNDPKFKCGCICNDPNGANTDIAKCRNKTCGLQYSKAQQAAFCAVEHPPMLPPFVQVPQNKNRAVAGSEPNPLPNLTSALPDRTCKLTDNGCATGILYTGKNKSRADYMASVLIPDLSSLSSIATLPSLSPSPAPSPSRSNPLKRPIGVNKREGRGGPGLFSSSFHQRRILASENATSSNLTLPSSLSPSPASDSSSNTSQSTQMLAKLVLGSATFPGYSLMLDPAVAQFGYQPDKSLYVLQKNCNLLNALQNSSGNSSPLSGKGNGTSNALSLNFQFSGMFSRSLPVKCLSTLSLWKPDNSSLNAQLYSGYYQSKIESNEQRISNEYAGAYDFRDSDERTMRVLVYYNSTFSNFTGSGGPPPEYVRVSRAMNLAANAFLRMVLSTKGIAWPPKNSSSAGSLSSSLSSSFPIPLLFIQDFPKPATVLSLDFSSLLGPLFYMWLVQLLYPVCTSSLVYEKEKRLRVMMKMHGLGDGAYYFVSYLYFLTLSLVYIAFLIIFGSIIGLKFFTLNDYSLQVLFFVVFINSQIALSFFTSTLFTKVKTATVVCYLYVFGSGLLGEFLVRFFVQDKTFPSGAQFAVELVPAFALYRGLFELSQGAFQGSYQGTKGLTWSKVTHQSENKFLRSVAILAVEWLLFLSLSLFIDQYVSSGSGVRKDLFGKNKKRGEDEDLEAAKALSIPAERVDVLKEREAVRSLLSSSSSSSPSHSIVCQDLRKVFPGLDKNGPKVAVKGMSVAIAKGECFGMLGPNGAGKTTSINMMIGFLSPTTGSALIEGFDLASEMDTIYSIMGVCPQHDLLWEQLTAREHLRFYGRLKNLKEPELSQAVDASLRSVNLYHSGVGDKRVGQFSGGMKRRLSVAVSLIGNPLVVYMDEPSTGLDPASRANLWDVIRREKKDRAIVLTTHSMEEAEALCDRLGIFVDGQFQCIGNPKELTSRYGGNYVLTITTPQENEREVSSLVLSLSPNAKRTYSLAGTQKFELPIQEVDIADVFLAVEEGKTRLDIQAWGVANTTLEDVFIKIAKEAQADISLS